MDWSLNVLMRFSQNLFLSIVGSVGNISFQEVKISIAVKRLVFFFPERVNVNCKQWFILPIFIENCCEVEIITLGLHILLSFKWWTTHETFLALINSMFLTFLYFFLLEGISHLKLSYQKIFQILQTIGMFTLLMPSKLTADNFQL